MNKAFLTGYLVRDPELSQTPSGKITTTITIGVRRPLRGEPKTDFFDIVCWDATAENVVKNFKKGRFVVASGYIYNETWDKDGKRMSKTKMNADTVERDVNSGSSYKDEAQEAPQEKPTMQAIDEDDGLPF